MMDFSIFTIDQKNLTPKREERIVISSILMALAHSRRVPKACYETREQLIEAFGDIRIDCPSQMRLCSAFLSCMETFYREICGFDKYQTRLAFQCLAGHMQKLSDTYGVKLDEGPKRT